MEEIPKHVTDDEDNLNKVCHDFFVKVKMGYCSPNRICLQGDWIFPNFTYLWYTFCKVRSLMENVPGVIFLV